jgi:hypothetical protein
VGGILNARDLHRLDHLGPLTNGATNPGGHSKVPFVPIMFWALLMERCATILAIFVIVGVKTNISMHVWYIFACVLVLFVFFQWKVPMHVVFLGLLPPVYPIVHSIY